MLPIAETVGCVSDGLAAEREFDGFTPASGGYGPLVRGTNGSFRIAATNALR
jgi:hypothetical protein